MQPKTYHIPALLAPTIEGLKIQGGGTYVDVTFGGGGHSRAIIQNLNQDGSLFSMDQDLDAYENAQSNEEGVYNLLKDSRWKFIHGNFRYLGNWMDYYGVKEIDGLLADLGVSFHHFDEAERGFSFRFAGPLDMRMNRQAPHTAAEIINTYSSEELARILYIYGELSNSRGIAERIVKARNSSTIETTDRLVEVVTGKKWSEEVDSRYKKDLAKVFQALRIEVNDELGALRELLISSKELLKSGGRIAILTYHSLEDRIVKNFMRSGNLEGRIEKDFYGNNLSPFRLIEKGRSADEEEVSRNPRARSAKLRVAEKI